MLPLAARLGRGRQGSIFQRREILRGCIRCLSSSTQKGSEGKVVVITSGKGGVGKTTTAASFAYGLAMKGHKTCVIDFDIGLRNLDIHLGCERRVIFDFVNVIQEECTLGQALIQDRRNPNLYLLAASQTKDKEALSAEGVSRVIKELQESFHFVVADSPAGIESGARHAMYLADYAIIVTNPELSSCRDSDKMVGFIASKSRRAELGQEPVQQTLLVTRYDAGRAAQDDMLRMEDIKELLGLDLIGLIPECRSVLSSTNTGQPVILSEEDAGIAYSDAVARFLGDEREMKFTTPKPVGLLKKIFG
ncbi:unnamed protein product [Chrysoparadoxa australica]